MIISSSPWATKYSLYRDIREPFEEIHINNMIETLDDYIETHEVDYYEHVKDYNEPHIEDEWSIGLGYSTSVTNDLIECDFCGERFTISSLTKLQRAGSYKSTLRRGGYNVDRYVEKFDHCIHVDNCESCLTEAKRYSTMMNHDGHAHISHTPKFREMMEEMQNGEVPCSVGQQYLANMLNGRVNESVDWYYPDIIIGDNIIVEYDGGGHNLSVKMGQITQEEFDKRERRRSVHLFSKGYKILRVVSEYDYFPVDEKLTEETIKNYIAELILSDNNELKIYLGNSYNDKTFGKMRPISEIYKKSIWGDKYEN